MIKENHNKKQNWQNLTIFCFLLFTLILIVCLFGAGVLQFGSLGVINYLIYIFAGLLSAFLTFQIMESTGQLIGKRWGIEIKLGGAIVALVLVAVGGALYERYLRTPDTFDVRVYLRYEDQSIPSSVEGNLILRLSGREIRADLNSTGSALFQDITNDYLGKSAQIVLISNCLRLTNPGVNIPLVNSNRSDAEIINVIVEQRSSSSDNNCNSPNEITVQTLYKLRQKLVELRGDWENKEGGEPVCRRIRREAAPLAEQFSKLEDSHLNLGQKIEKYEYMLYSYLIAADVEKKKEKAIPYTDLAIQSGEKALNFIEKETDHLSDFQYKYDLNNWLKEDLTKDKINMLLALTHSVRTRLGVNDVGVNDVKKTIDYINKIEDRFEQEEGYIKDNPRLASFLCNESNPDICPDIETLQKASTCIN